METNFELTVFVDDRVQSEAILADIRAIGAETGFDIARVDEEDAVGIDVADLIYTIIISFGTSVAANLVTPKVNELIRRLKGRGRGVSDASARPLGGDGDRGSAAS